MKTRRMISLAVVVKKRDTWGNKQRRRRLFRSGGQALMKGLLQKYDTKLHSKLWMDKWMDPFIKSLYCL